MVIPIPFVIVMVGMDGILVLALVLVVVIVTAGASGDIHSGGGHETQHPACRSRPSAVAPAAIPQLVFLGREGGGGCCGGRVELETLQGTASQGTVDAERDAEAARVARPLAAALVASRPDRLPVFLLLLLLGLFLIGLGWRTETVGDLVAPRRDEGFVVVFVVAIVTIATGEREGERLGAKW